MKRKAFLAAAVAATMAIGGAAALADTAVADSATDAPAPLVQTQVRQQVQIQEPSVAATEDALQLLVQTREQVRVVNTVTNDDVAPAEPVQEREREQVRVEDGTQTQDGTLTQTRTQTRIQDPEDCDGECDGERPGYATGECDAEGPADNEGPEDGTGHQNGNGGDANGGGNSGGNGN